MHRDLKAFYETKYQNGTEIARSSKRLALDCIPVGTPLDVLDVGCGAGVNSLVIASKGHRVRGTDISEAAIQRYRAHGFQGNVADLEQGIDEPAGSVDLVFCSEVIEHLTSPSVLVSEIIRLLRPGGLLVLSTPNSAFWLYRLLGLFGFTVSELQHPKHFQFFSKRSLLRLLEAKGLKVKKAFGRNMYAILPDPPAPVWPIFRMLGFQRETRFRTGKSFWHLSRASTFLNGLFADTLIVVMEKPH
jgi:2-polyprenyl-3-methyl-5-hydroxy-6-metoxy-1,4-benzoquinol methylase